MIYYVSCTNIHKGDGSRENPFRTIRQAAAKARTGDTIVIGGGKYREMVEPVYGGQSDLARITYSAAEGEKVIISGAEAFDHWERQEGRLWKTTVDNAVFGDVNPFDTLICGDWYDNFGQDHHTAEVYLEDEALYEAASYNALISMDKPMTWFAVAHEDLTEVWANFGDVDPNTTCTEYNARVSCFFPRHEGVDYITLKGITFEKAATQWAPPTGFQIGLVGVHWSKGWIIEDCEIRHSKCSGLSLGKRYEEDDNLWTRNGLKGGTQTYTETIIKNSQRDWKKEYLRDQQEVSLQNL